MFVNKNPALQGCFLRILFFNIIQLFVLFIYDSLNKASKNNTEFKYILLNELANKETSSLIEDNYNLNCNQISQPANIIKFNSKRSEKDCYQCRK